MVLSICKTIGLVTVPSKIHSSVIALGLMTEKTIEQGKSVSVHGQGLTGEWGPFTIRTSKKKP